MAVGEEEKTQQKRGTRSRMKKIIDKKKEIAAQFKRRSILRLIKFRLNLL